MRQPPYHREQIRRGNASRTQIVAQQIPLAQASEEKTLSITNASTPESRRRAGSRRASKSVSRDISVVSISRTVRYRPASSGTNGRYRLRDFSPPLSSSYTFSIPVPCLCRRHGEMVSRS